MKTLTSFLFRLYPHQFILETKGTVRYIHALENEGRHFYDFSAEVAIPPLTKTLNEEELVVAETVHATPVPVPMPVLFVRDALARCIFLTSRMKYHLKESKKFSTVYGKRWDGLGLPISTFSTIVPSGSLAERINLLLGRMRVQMPPQGKTIKTSSLSLNRLTFLNNIRQPETKILR